MNNIYRFKQKHTVPVNPKIICENHGLVDSVNNILRNFNRDNVRLAKCVIESFLVSNCVHNILLLYLFLFYHLIFPIRKQ